MKRSRRANSLFRPIKFMEAIIGRIYNELRPIVSSIGSMGRISLACAGHPRRSSRIHNNFGCCSVSSPHFRKCRGRSPFGIAPCGQVADVGSVDSAVVVHEYRDDLVIGTLSGRSHSGTA